MAAEEVEEEVVEEGVEEVVVGRVAHSAQAISRWREVEGAGRITAQVPRTSWTLQLLSRERHFRRSAWP